MITNYMFLKIKDMKRKLKFNQAINEAIYQAMKSDKKNSLLWFGSN